MKAVAILIGVVLLASAEAAVAAPPQTTAHSVGGPVTLAKKPGSIGGKPTVPPRHH